MSTVITTELFSDFVQCRRKAYLRLTGQAGQESQVVRLQGRLLQDYHAQVRAHLLQAYRGKDICAASSSLSAVLLRRYDLAIDVTAIDSDSAIRFDALLAAPGAASAREPAYVPVVFGFEEKIRKEHRLWLALCASLLGRQQRCSPPFGRIVHGVRFTSTRIQPEKLLANGERAFQEFRAIEQASCPPRVHLTALCSRCMFSHTCRATAVATDDLSLLQSLKPKEILKLRKKGIFTVTQLSYTFRARRRSRRSNPRIIKYYHSLKALAIREKTIYVAGTPTLDMTGTPVYLDVEGVPDRDFYYLIGIRFHGDGAYVQRSLWAGDKAEEQTIWQEFLQVLATIERPQLLHYGRYETTFLRRMRIRYGGTTTGPALMDDVIEGAQNILSVVYGHIYFPAYSNGLKDIAASLGYHWSTPEPSGQHSLLLRHEWEVAGTPSAKQALIAYNADDCAALEMVVRAILQVIGRDAALPTLLPSIATVHVDSMKPEGPHRLGPIDFVLPEFDKINKCAYWDYQRDRVYVRSSPRLRRAAQRKSRRRHQCLPVNKTFNPSRPWKCFKCGSPRIAKNGRHSRLLYDLRFGCGSVKRWITRYHIDHYKCSGCGASFASDKYEWTKHRYGLALLAYVIYSIIELHIPQLKLVRSMYKLFGYRLHQPAVNRLKQRATELYRETHDEIKVRLLSGRLIHADETQMGARDGAGYVWVFTSMEEVVYLWSPTREADVAREFLKDFKGVLVSEFYSAYDSLDCDQQKCLVHLIRDLNEGILKEPFNEEIRAIAHDFAALVKPMIETIDRFGLKRRFLTRHKGDVKRFYEKLLGGAFESETGHKLQERFRRNQGKLFTFLDHDGVPWNNNNAEHAIKAFSAIREVIQGYSNERGIREYLVLLSICQTCEYRGVDFLGFLRSGGNQIEEYIRKKGR